MRSRGAEAQGLRIELGDGAGGELMQGFSDATIKGYQDTLDDPEKCINALVNETQGVDKELATAQLDAYIPLMGDSDTYGQFSDDSLKELSDFLVENDLAKQPIAPNRYATNEYTGGDELSGSE